jgi:hypothetical protein
LAAPRPVAVRAGRRGPRGLAEVLRLAETGDASGVNRLVAEERVFLVEDGGRVRVLEAASLTVVAAGARVALEPPQNRGKSGADAVSCGKLTTRRMSSQLTAYT